uniref:Uncharacterized protein n=1 Tax=Chromera velia CCMP2878 TaxID=1169474 RepID=A0A0G4IEZ0_9ALVE|eukprot:Cvel_13746.t1-p1 / transcript=Cvel_13746.t1 / gene=Cvel_13746 / organism=Chromera_velia_CCMP2878 / gene_product=hypothetical protein / transcript_product=hypothetical protein / location=Cvel_scaffold951:47294-50122(-) / protein_length=542 / sequence_SO=supercontig / SO=protein_coding / is_pseudo=false
MPSGVSQSKSPSHHLAVLTCETRADNALLQSWRNSVLYRFSPSQSVSLSVDNICEGRKWKGFPVRSVWLREFLSGISEGRTEVSMVTRKENGRRTNICPVLGRNETLKVKGRQEHGEDAEGKEREIPVLIEEFTTSLSEQEAGEAEWLGVSSTSGPVPLSLSSVSIEKRLLPPNTDVVALTSDSDVFANRPISATELIEKWHEIRKGSPVLVSTQFSCWLGRRCSGLDLSLYYSSALGHPSTFFSERPPAVHPIFLCNGLMMGRAGDLSRLWEAVETQMHEEERAVDERRQKERETRSQGQGRKEGPAVQRVEKSVSDQNLLSEAVRRGLLHWPQEKADKEEDLHAEGKGGSDSTSDRREGESTGSVERPFIQFDFFQELFGNLYVMEGNATASPVNETNGGLDRTAFFPADGGEEAQKAWRNASRLDFGELGPKAQPHFCWDPTAGAFAYGCEKPETPTEDRLEAVPEADCALQWKHGWHRATENLEPMPVLFHAPGLQDTKNRLHEAMQMMDRCLGEGTLDLPNFKNGSRQEICHECPVS